MDDSRSIHQSGSLVSRAALPSQSTSCDFQFSCRQCGGSEYHVETRPGVEVWLASLRIYQAVGFSDLAGHHSIFTCIRCEASVQRAHDEARDALIGKLLFAAKHLTETQFTRRVQYGRAELICAQCRMPQVDDNRLIHRAHCAVGRVAGLLHGLMSLDDPKTLQQALLAGDGGLISLPAAVCAENGGVQ